MIPAEILNALDVDGIEYEQEPDGIVPVLPDAFYDAMSKLDPEQFEIVGNSVAGHCLTYTKNLMDRSFVPIYGEQWRSVLNVMHPQTRLMVQMTMEQNLKSANLGRYIKRVLN